MQIVCLTSSSVKAYWKFSGGGGVGGLSAGAGGGFAVCHAIVCGSRSHPSAWTSGTGGGGGLQNTTSSSRSVPRGRPQPGAVVELTGAAGDEVVELTGAVGASGAASAPEAELTSVAVAELADAVGVVGSAAAAALTVDANLTSLLDFVDLQHPPAAAVGGSAVAAGSRGVSEGFGPSLTATEEGFGGTLLAAAAAGGGLKAAASAAAEVTVAGGVAAAAGAAA